MQTFPSALDRKYPFHDNSWFFPPGIPGDLGGRRRYSRFGRGRSSARSNWRLARGGSSVPA